MSLAVIPKDILDKRRREAEKTSLLLYVIDRSKAPNPRLCYVLLGLLLRQVSVSMGNLSFRQAGR